MNIKGNKSKNNEDRSMPGNKIVMRIISQRVVHVFMKAIDCSCGIEDFIGTHLCKLCAIL